MRRFAKIIAPSSIRTRELNITVFLLFRLGSYFKLAQFGPKLGQMLATVMAKVSVITEAKSSCNGRKFTCSLSKTSSVVLLVRTS